MSEQAKAKGNSAFSSGDYAAAIRHFTEAIALSPTPSHVLYSNRSAAHASLGDFTAALTDAQKTVELNPSWTKGYSRLGAAHVGLKDYSAAVAAYKKGLDLEPANEALKSGLTDAETAATAAARSRARGTGEFDEELNLMREARSSYFRRHKQSIWRDIKGPGDVDEVDGTTMRGYLAQPDFVKIMQEIQKNPNSMNLYLKDPRVMKAIGVLLNVNFSAHPGRSEDAEMAEESREEKGAEEKLPQAPAAAPAESMEVEEDLGEEEKECKEKKVRAKKEKEEGIAAYKKKDFEKVIQCYTKAVVLDDEDISFLTNRAAVYLEMGRYEDCFKDCDKAVERGRELRSDFKMIAKALTRKGIALVKIAKSSKDYELAIQTFQKALTEHRNPDTLKKLNDAEKAKKELEQQEYFDPKIADEEHEKGNEFFKEQKYPEAVKHYTEALKRNPKDPRVYSNRAACYTKLGALPEGLKDAEKCIELDPAFSKGYTRKGALQFFMKEYDKALETYQEGLKHDSSNQELLDGIRRCVEQINKASRGDFTPEELKERQAKAMQDPEIQNILTDPVMRQVLVDFQENPKAAQEHTKNPMVMSKIQKLVSAGIVQIK